MGDHKVCHEILDKKFAVTRYKGITAIPNAQKSASVRTKNILTVDIVDIVELFSGDIFHTENFSQSCKSKVYNFWTLRFSKHCTVDICNTSYTSQSCWQRATDSFKWTRINWELTQKADWHFLKFAAIHKCLQLFFATNFLLSKVCLLSDDNSPIRLYKVAADP